jgi:hypothetical protein
MFNLFSIAHSGKYNTNREMLVGSDAIQKEKRGLSQKNDGSSEKQANAHKKAATQKEKK